MNRVSATSRRIAAVLATVALALAAGLPAAEACCTMPAAAEASVHAAMTCCGESCEVTEAPVAAANDEAVLQPRSESNTAPIVTSVEPLADTTSAASPAGVQLTALFASPPATILHHQFRI